VGRPDYARRMRAGLLAVTLVALVLAACHDDDDQEEPARVPAGTLAAPLLAEEVPTTPLRCFEEAGLANPERRGPGLWRATEPGAGTLVIVEDMPSPAHARQAERRAPPASPLAPTSSTAASCTGPTARPRPSPTVYAAIEGSRPSWRLKAPARRRRPPERRTAAGP
jgi:hypothetical protein